MRTLNFGLRVTELVHDPDQTELGASAHLSHFAIAVESMAAVIGKLAAAGIGTEPPVSPDGSDDFLTTWIVDPDGRRIGLVQWPPGHADGITAADFAEHAP